MRCVAAFIGTRFLQEETENDKIVSNLKLASHCFHGASSISALIGIPIGYISLFRFSKLCKQSPNSANLFGIIICLLCLLNHFAILGEICCKEVATIFVKMTMTISKDIESYFAAIFRGSNVTLKLLVVAQSFTRYILICKPHLKHILTRVMGLVTALFCVILGGVDQFLYYKCYADHVMAMKLDFLVFAEDDSEEYMPKMLVVYSIYHFFVSSAPCIFGIYFNRDTAVELRKACAFVVHERRNAKFARLMKLSLYFTRMLVFYAIVDVANQIEESYRLIGHMENMRFFSAVESWKNPVRRSVEMICALFYSFQSTFILSVFYWFMTKAEK